MISKNEIDSLKKNFLVLRIYGNKINLEKRGREYIGICPFHGEKTGSFSINQNREGYWLYHCFGCGESGSIIDFVQKTDNLSFKDAVKSIKEKIGSTDWEKNKQQVDQVFHSIDAGNREYKTYTLQEYQKLEDAFAKSEDAQAWLLNERGIDFDTAQRLHIGFRQDLGRVAGVPNKDIADKGWISFPCIEGNTVTSIKYRSLVRKAFARQPGMKTTLFNTETIDFLEPLVIVEGEIDGMTLEMAGFHAVSLPNASYKLTPEMRDAVLQSEKVILAGDCDDGAGVAAMDRLKADFGDRAIRIKWPDGMKDANDTFVKYCSKDIDKFRELVYSLIREAKSQPLPGVYSLADIMSSGQQESLVDHPDRFRFPWKSVDEMAILMPGAVAASTASVTGSGKALANGTPVLTPTGFVPIDSLEVGQFVIGSDGKPTRVIGVFPQGSKNAYKVTFSDESNIICCDEHLWAVQTVWDRFGKKPFRVMSLKDIMKKGFKRNNGRGYNFSIPVVKPISFKEDEDNFFIHPYVLGCLLGDRSICGPQIQFTSTDDEVIENIRQRLPDCAEIRKSKRKNTIQYSIVHKGHRRHNRSLFWVELENLGLRGTKSDSKFIPEIYKYSSIENRKELIRGLLDTDGSATQNNGVSFSTASWALLNDFIFVVKSLGGTHGKIQKRHRIHKGLPEFSVRIYLGNNFQHFNLSRKQNRLKERTKRVDFKKDIINAEYIGQKEMTCIKVEAEDGLFVAKDFIVTHNTVFWIGATLYSARKNNEVILNYQVELSPPEVANIVAANVLAKDRNTLTKEDYHKAGNLLSGVRYYVGADPTLTDAEAALDLIESAVKRLGITVVVLDHLHFLTTGDNEISQQTKAMQRIKNMARTYGLKFIVIGQPRKADQKNKGKSVHISDMKGSESVMANSDIGYFLHRESVKNIDPSNPPADLYEPETEIHLVKGRSRGKGKAFTRLYYAGALATFLDIDNTHEEEN